MDPGNSETLVFSVITKRTTFAQIDAAKLGLSAWKIREALIGLQRRGWIKSHDDGWSRVARESREREGRP